MKTDKTKNDSGFVSRSLTPLKDFRQLVPDNTKCQLHQEAQLCHTPLWLSEARWSGQQDHIYMVILKEILK